MRKKRKEFGEPWISVSCKGVRTKRNKLKYRGEEWRERKRRKDEMRREKKR